LQHEKADREEDEEKGQEVLKVTIKEALKALEALHSLRSAAGRW